MSYSEQEKKNIRYWFFNYGSISIFTLGLIILVCLSYYFSRYIPSEFFMRRLSPFLHGCLLVVAIVGAIVMHWHTYGIRARKMWQQALIAWSVMEVVLLFAEKYLGISTVIRGVYTIDRLDFIIRDVMAIILLAYPMEVLCPKWLNWWRCTLLVLPSILIAWLDLSLDEDLRALMIVYPLLIAGWLWVKTREYRAKVENTYSSLENSAMPWLRVYLSILTVIGLSYFYLSFTTHPTRVFTQQWLVLVLLTYNTAQIVFRGKPWKETAENAEEEEEEDPVLKQYRSNLETWMAESKPYLNPEFRLVDLMQVLPMNRTYLSNFINTEYGCTFYQYVTNYRIEEAKRLMKEHPEMKLQEIAEQSGFSSAAVFSRTFVKETGVTPTEWLNSPDNI